MISHQNKCIYVHIPKVAGSSIIEALEDPEDKNNYPEVSKTPPTEFNFTPPPSHFRAIDYLKYHYINEQEYHQYFKFSFVRNPWARIVSEYKYRNHAWKYPFKDFIFKYFPHAKWSDEYCHVIPQYNFLYDKEGNKQVDFIGKFENLQKDFDEVCKLMNIPNIKLPHKNQSASFFQLRSDASFCDKLKRLRGKLSLRQKRNTFEHYSQYYDMETKEYVSQIYKNDIEVFDYQFVDV